MILTTTEGQTNLPRYFTAVIGVLGRMKRGRLDVTLPDGRVFRASGAAPGYAAAIEVHNPDLFARTIREGDLGFCEAYMDAWFDTPDLQGLMDVILINNDSVGRGFPGQGLVKYFERFRHWMNRNTKEQAAKNISYHYDLGNEFYSAWLDDSMTYSSALYRSNNESLHEAQINKYASIMDRMGAGENDQVLEVGCG